MVECNLHWISTHISTIQVSLSSKALQSKTAVMFYYCPIERLLSKFQCTPSRFSFKINIKTLLNTLYVVEKRSVDNIEFISFGHDHFKSIKRSRQTRYRIIIFCKIIFSSFNLCCQSCHTLLCVVTYCIFILCDNSLSLFQQTYGNCFSIIKIHCSSSISRRSTCPHTHLILNTTIVAQIIFAVSSLQTIRLLSFCRYEVPFILPTLFAYRLCNNFISTIICILITHHQPLASIWIKLDKAVSTFLEIPVLCISICKFRERDLVIIGVCVPKVVTTTALYCIESRSCIVGCQCERIAALNCYLNGCSLFNSERIDTVDRVKIAITELHRFYRLERFRFYRIGHTFNHRLYLCFNLASTFVIFKGKFHDILQIIECRCCIEVCSLHKLNCITLIYSCPGIY